MKSIFLYIGLIWIFSTYPAHLLAQDKPKIVVKNPISRQGEALKSNALETNMKGETEIFCVEDGIVPLKQPDEKEPSGYPILNFGDTFNFVDTEQFGGSVYYLLTKGDANNQIQYIGWVNADALLLSSACLKDEFTHIQKKALLIVKNKPGSSELTGTPRWTNSSAKGTPLPPLSFYSIMFCYKKRNGYTLLGFAGKFKPTRGKDDITKEDFWTTMAGWVPDEGIEEWNTREALKWHTDSTLETYRSNRRVPDGHIFYSRKDAILSRNSHVVPGWVEPGDQKNQSPPWPKDKMRYPIFNIVSNKNKDQRPGEQSGPESEGGLADTVDPVRGRLFRIGVIDDLGNHKDEVGKLVFREGWVWEKNKLGQPQIQIQVLLTSFELENLKNHILNPIIDAFEDGRNPESIIYEKMADELNALQVREKPEKNTYKNIIEKRYGLTLKSKLFDITFGINDKGELLKNNQNQDEKSDQKTDLFLIYKKSLLIGDALNNISMSYTEEKSKDSSGNIIRKWKAVGNPVKTDRFFKQPGASTVSQFIWIDRETEFP